MNEFKFSILRQMGSEQASFTSTIHSDKQELSDEELKGQAQQFDIFLAHILDTVIVREVREKDVLTASSKAREEKNKQLEEQLKKEIEAGQSLTETKKKNK